MLKLRIEGPRKDIYAYVDYLRSDKNIKLLDVSNCFNNRGISVYSRCFVELETPVKTANIENTNTLNEELGEH